MNIKVIHTDQKNPYLLSAEEEKTALKKQSAHRAQLTVPRRPAWDSTTTPAELDRLERESFLLWRRGLAELQENRDLYMTPFERNLEMWRQLWRVIERSDLVVQIVDARHPLLFRCEDLVNYVKEVDPRKNNLLLINKADMMTAKQRGEWAEYFEREKIQYTFFSAALAIEEEEDEEAYEDIEEEEEELPVEEALSSMALKDGEAEGKEEELDDDEEEEEVEEEDERTRILSANELEELFLKHAPPPSKSSSPTTLYSNFQC